MTHTSSYVFVLFCFDIATVGIDWVGFFSSFSRFENLTRAFISKVVSSKWVKYQLCVNYTFKTGQKSLRTIKRRENKLNRRYRTKMGRQKLASSEAVWRIGEVGVEGGSQQEGSAAVSGGFKG